MTAGRTNVTMSLKQELIRELRDEAKYENRTLSNYVEVCLMSRIRSRLGECEHDWQIDRNTGYEDAVIRCTKCKEVAK
jgi:hypothetical protein